MAGSGGRMKITLACQECKQRNYNTKKNKKNDPDRLEMKKHCKFCRKHTEHKETKQKGETVKMSEEKNLPVDKAKEKEKRENQRNALKAAAAKRPRRSPLRFFREAKAEFKKVTWPTPKQVLNNTGVVLTAITVTALLIFGFDWLFSWVLSIVYQVNLR